jgi:ligand-binding SRPBCC domain-containing protein
MILRRTTEIAAPLPEVFAFFSEPANLGLITPPSMGFRIVEGPDRSLRAGDRIVYRIRVAGLPLRWVTRITEWEENRTFTDVQEKGPYSVWVHTHTFEEVDGKVRMHDLVRYELPLGMVGRISAGWFVRRQLAAIFDYRERVIRERFRER